MIQLCSASIDNIRLWNAVEAGESDGNVKGRVQFKIIPGHHGGYVSQMGKWTKPGWIGSTDSGAILSCRSGRAIPRECEQQSWVAWGIYANRICTRHQTKCIRLLRDGSLGTRLHLGDFKSGSCTAQVPRYSRKLYTHRVNYMSFSSSSPPIGRYKSGNTGLLFTMSSPPCDSTTP